VILRWRPPIRHGLMVCVITQGPHDAVARRCAFSAPTRGASPAGAAAASASPSKVGALDELRRTDTSLATGKGPIVRNARLHTRTSAPAPRPPSPVGLRRGYQPPLRLQGRARARSLPFRRGGGAGDAVCEPRGGGTARVEKERPSNRVPNERYGALEKRPPAHDETSRKRTHLDGQAWPRERARRSVHWMRIWSTAEARALPSRPTRCAASASRTLLSSERQTHSRVLSLTSPRGSPCSARARSVSIWGDVRRPGRGVAPDARARSGSRDCNDQSIRVTAHLPIGRWWRAPSRRAEEASTHAMMPTSSLARSPHHPARAVPPAT
jgi:hypothetical protein